MTINMQEKINTHEQPGKRIGWRRVNWLIWRKKSGDEGKMWGLGRE